MKVNKAKQGDGTVLLKASANAEDVNKAFALAEMEMANSLGINGQQQSESLKELAERKLGIKDLDTILEASTVEALAPFAIEESGIDPAYPPHPEHSAPIKRDQPFEFTLKVAPKPEYELISYDPVEITLPEFMIDEAQVDEQLRQMAERSTTYETADPKPLEKDDACLLAIKCFEDGEELKGMTTDGRTYIVGQGFMPADFDEHILGMTPGETREFVFEGPSIDKDFKQFAQKFDCTVTLIEIQKPVVPEITDEWIKANMPMFDSVEDMRNDIRASIERRDREQYEQYKRQMVATALVERFQGRIADEVYETARDNLMRNIMIGLQQQGITWEDYVAQNGGEQQINMMMMLQVREMVVQGYVFDAFFRHENMTLDDEDILEACRMMAPGMNPQQVRAQAEAEGKGFVLRESAQRLKANKWVADHAKITIQK